jgi:hypothetical protein
MILLKNVDQRIPSCSRAPGQATTQIKSEWWLNHAEATNNCVVGRKFGVMEGNIHRWWQMKERNWEMQTPPEHYLEDLRKDISIC